MDSSDLGRLEELFVSMHRQVDTYIGYPVNAAFDYSPLARFLRLPLNNVGDPFAGGPTRVNTHEFEREVVRDFARLAGDENAWGYVTTGGSEGNVYGLMLARERFPDGVAYHSADSHPSIAKALRLLRVSGVEVRSLPDGSLDPGDFRERLRTEAPAIVVANVGTTMKGAVDDLPGIRAALDNAGIGRRFIHADAALAGMVLPFADEPPPWDFRAGVDSITISGHKLIGSPVPCGVILTRREHAEHVAHMTIPGSRDGLAPLFLWYAWRTHGVAGFHGIVRACFKVAEYAVERLRIAGRHPWRHPHSLTVIFDRPAAESVRKWQLGVKGNLARLVAMPHVTHAHVDWFVREL
jgi:histidine decarboxylase